MLNQIKNTEKLCRYLPITLEEVLLMFLIEFGNMEVAHI
jgi:hypothetical protein